MPEEQRPTGIRGQGPIWLALAILGLLQILLLTRSELLAATPTPAAPQPAAKAPATIASAKQGADSTVLLELRKELRELQQTLAAQPPERGAEIAQLTTRVSALEKQRATSGSRVATTPVATPVATTTVAATTTPPNGSRGSEGWSARVFAVEEGITREGKARLEFQSNLLKRLDQLEKRQTLEESARIEGMRLALDRIGKGEQRILDGENRDVALKRSLDTR